MNAMKEKHKLFKRCMASTCLLLILGFTQALSQQTLASAGGNATGNLGSAGYSFGQVFYSIHSKPEGSITEGLQQPFEISIVAGMNESGEISMDYEAYPNPVTCLLVLRVDRTATRHLAYQLLDISGRLLKSKKITCTECMIPMEQYESGIYFLNLISGDKRVKIFKIIKN